MDNQSIPHVPRAQLSIVGGDQSRDGAIPGLGSQGVKGLGGYVVPLVSSLGRNVLAVIGPAVAVYRPGDYRCGGKRSRRDVSRGCYVAGGH